MRVKAHPYPFLPPTNESLSKAALRYLSRFAASEASLRRVLNNQLRRAMQRCPNFVEDHEKQQRLKNEIDVIIERHKSSGTLNDAAYAETKIYSLRRAGRSRRSIQQHLNQKGIEHDIITSELLRSDNDKDPGTTELEAALRLAQRRKLGQFRQRPGDGSRFQKDLAAMARAGFSLAIARQALGSKVYLEENDHH